MADTAAELRDLLDTHRPEHAAAGFPPWLRDRVARYVRERREAGETWARLAAQLGVSHAALRSWTRVLAEPGFLPVHVVERADEPETTPPAQVVEDRSQLTLVSPRGFHLHGLSLRDASTLLDLLG